MINYTELHIVDSNTNSISELKISTSISAAGLNEILRVVNALKPVDEFDKIGKQITKLLNGLE